VLGTLADRSAILGGAERWVVPGADGETSTTLFVADGVIAAVVSPKPLKVRWVEEIRRARRAAGGLESLPDFIALSCPSRGSRP
jgi:uncharacterized protein YndB with AHSA1/START domain